MLSLLALSYLNLARTLNLALSKLALSLKVTSLLEQNLLAPNCFLKLRNSRLMIGNRIIMLQLECGDVSLALINRDLKCGLEPRNLRLIIARHFLEDIGGGLVTLLQIGIELRLSRLILSLSPHKLQVEGLALGLQEFDPLCMGIGGCEMLLDLIIETIDGPGKNDVFGSQCVH